MGKMENSSCGYHEPSVTPSTTQFFHKTCKSIHSTKTMDHQIGSTYQWHLALLIFACCSLQSSQMDTLVPGQSLRDGETLASEGGIFELGFFSPGSSKNRYVGIWYKKDPKQTPVWVGNRYHPLRDHGSTLTLSSSGDLAILFLLTVSGDHIQIAKTEAKNTSIGAKLFDSGNLVILYVLEGLPELWKSFDHPTDTLLPGMGKALYENRSLTSWTSQEDPAPGNFTFRISSNGVQFEIQTDQHLIYWRSAIWGSPDLAENSIYQFVKENISNYVEDGSNLTRLVIGSSGKITLFTWSADSQDWKSVLSEPQNQCHLHCGAFSICVNKSFSTCKCVHGFEPFSPKEWSSGHYPGGCMRKTKLQCQDNSSVIRENDVFSTMKNLKLPLKFQCIAVSSARECELACLNNCSCTAYAFGPDCLLWHEALSNLQQSANVSEYGGALLVRLAAYELMSTGVTGNKSRRLLECIIFPIVLLILIVGSFICYLQQRKVKQKEKETSEGKLLLDLSRNIAAANKIRNAYNLKEGGKKCPQLKLFSFSSIAFATDDFSSINKLGQGGFGPVYKGKFPEGQEIAVKRLARSSQQGLEEFKTEVVLSSRLHHKNLVSLLGCCIHREEKLLIYEYMPNRSLSSYLFDPTKRPLLDSAKRITIIEGIVEGLVYLHKYSGQTVIHRDLKASNILLDSEMNPRISDFGMARIFEGDEVQASTKRVVGTYGYMPPEYTMQGNFSERSDVFSFGVLLLEILSGNKNTIIHLSGCSLNLLGYAWELWKEGRGVELLDSVLVDSLPISEQVKYIHIALLCVQESVMKRPTMLDVDFMLRDKVSDLPAPTKPAFYIESCGTGTDLPKNTLRSLSLNNVTFSTLEGR